VFLGFHARLPPLLLPSKKWQWTTDVQKPAERQLPGAGHAEAGHLNFLSWSRKTQDMSDRCWCSLRCIFEPKPVTPPPHSPPSPPTATRFRIFLNSAGTSEEAAAGSWTPCHSLGGHFGAVVDLAWSFDGACLLSVSADQTARIITRAADGSWLEAARPQVWYTLLPEHPRDRCPSGRRSPQAHDELGLVRGLLTLEVVRSWDGGA